jgi:hypothetical protein
MDGDATDLSLADVLLAAAEGIEGVVALAGPVTTWSIGGAPFATLAGSTAEFRLDPLVAAAALRTPDTATSERGPEWVSFSPGLLDDAAVDRAEAWFLSAARRAATKRPGNP